MFKKVMEKKNGMMEPSMLELTKMEWKMGMDFISGLMVVYIKATGLKTKYKVMENISGMIKGHFKGIG